MRNGMGVSKPKGRSRHPAPPIIYEALPVGGALIAEQLPRYDYRDALQIVVVASPEAVFKAMPRETPRGLTLLGPLAVVAERPGQELVLGAGFEKPGFEKTALSWIVKPIGSGQSLLIVEWRIRLSDDTKKSAFRRHWVGIDRIARLSARAALRRIKEACETCTSW